MTEKRQIDDGELVEITGGDGFVEVDDDCGCRPSPPPGGAAHSPEGDNEPGGDQEFGE